MLREQRAPQRDDHTRQPKEIIPKSKRAGAVSVSGPGQGRPFIELSGALVLGSHLYCVSDGIQGVANLCFVLAEEASGLRVSKAWDLIGLHVI